MTKYATHQWHLGYLLLFPAVILFSSRDNEDFPWWVNLLLALAGWTVLWIALGYTEKMAYKYGSEGGKRHQFGAALVNRFDGKWTEVKGFDSAIAADDFVHNYNIDAGVNGYNERATLIRRNRSGKWKLWN